MNFEELKMANENKIKEIKLQIEKDRDNEVLNKKLVVQTQIRALLNSDKALFFNISVEDAYKILGQILDDRSIIKETYIRLTSPQEYIKHHEKI